MVKAKKTAALTVEERLERALVPDGEQPYPVPENWCWVRLESLIELISGRDAELKDCNNTGKGIPYILGASNLDNNTFTIERWIECPQVVSQKDDILLSVKGTIGKIYLQQEMAINISRQVMALRFNKVYKTNCAYWYLQKICNELREVGNGLIPGISRKDILDKTTPFPPLAEQQRIVDRIENLFAKLDEAKEKAQAALDSFETRKAAILHKAFTGGFSLENDTEEITALLNKVYEVREDLIRKKTIQRAKISPVTEENMIESFPSKWKQVKIGEIAFVTKLAGFEYTKYINLKESGEVPVIRAQNVRKGYLDTTNLLFIDKATSELLPRSALTKKSLLITFIGAGIGDVCIFENQKRFHLAPNVAKVEFYCTEREEINIRYVQYYLLSPFGQKEILKSMKATAQPSLSMETIRDIIISIPDSYQQTKIVHILDSFFAKEQKAKELCSVLDNIDLIKKSILARAFRGELGTNDPTEESAVELLKSRV